MADAAVYIRQFELPTAAEQDFVAALQQLNAGELARLRRAAGLAIHESKMDWTFYRLLPRESVRNLELYFLVATLFALGGKYVAQGDNVGDSLRLLGLLPDVNAVSLGRRIAILLDASLGTVPGGDVGAGELGYRLRQVVKLLASKQRGLNWAQLLHDINQWSIPGKPAQKRWAKAYFSRETPPGHATPGSDT
jgi:CRISPR type I-E-associated protein CasB/Cse2